MTNEELYNFVAKLIDKIIKGLDRKTPASVFKLLWRLRELEDSIYLNLLEEDYKSRLKEKNNG